MATAIEIEKAMLQPAYEKSTLIALFGAFGISTVVAQADLIGHWFGFEASSAGVQPLGNPRLFFLAGYTVSSIIAIFIARFRQRQLVVVKWLVFLTASIGALLYGFAYASTLVPPNVSAIIGLVLYGVGYLGATLFLYCELAKLKRLSVALWAIAASLFLKTILGDAIGSVSSGAIQIVITALLSLASLACLSAMSRLSCPEHLARYRSERSITAAEKRNLIYLLVAVSVILAALRGLSHLGLWGEGYLGSPVASFAGYVVVGLMLAGFTYATVIRNSNDRMLIRFQPAFLVLIGGFLIYALKGNLFDPMTLEPVFSWLMVAVELFGHLLFWAVTLTAMRTTTDPLWRFPGVINATYGVVAIAWALVLLYTGIGEGVLAVAAAFLAMAAAIRPLSRKPAEAEATIMGPAPLDRIETPDNARGSAPPAQAPGEHRSIGDHIAQCHQKLALQHGLSPRETDVFLLLAQGRSRPYISTALYLSDGTVKTHISHIYKKFGVHTREELLTIVQNAKTQKQAEDSDHR